MTSERQVPDPNAGSPRPDGKARWDRVENLFHEALALPSDERPAFLGAACAGDDALRDEVTSLLAATDDTSAFRDDAAHELALELTDVMFPRPMADPDATLPGGTGALDKRPERPERIGPYFLLDVLGHGGMGTVYLAEQREPLPRRVALKLIRWGGIHEETLRRFEIEREAMARLSHPAIAQVFDAGTSEHGQPYIVLEYIPGEPITNYCDDHGLDLRERLQLLVEVCHGVRHAHEKGVIHRDLKPSNILVADAATGPRPKIIDFGIAKALAPWSEAAAAMTATQLRVGSPGYMSPEAMTGGGRAVDTRSDVFALGVILYELLAGIRPFDSATWPSDSRAWETAAESPRPSRRLRALPPDERRAIADRRGLDAVQLERRLRGELDWIARRATQVDPAARYGTAAGLASDIERWLHGQPVQAKPTSFFYVARKAIRRHALAFGTAFLVLATVVGFGIRSNILYGRAEAARLQAEELVAFMLDDLSTHLEPQGRLEVLEAIARESLGYFESASGRDLAAAGRRPTVALCQIGRVLAAKGDLDAAIEAYDKAREIDLRRHERAPRDPGPWLDLARDLALLSEAREARGEVRMAGEHLGEAERLLRELVAEQPEHLEARRRLASFLADELSGFRRVQNDPAAARSSLEEGLEILRGLLQSDPDDAALRHELGQAHYEAGLLAVHGFDNAEEAARDFEAAVEIYRALARDQPDSTTWRQRLAVMQGHGLSTAYREIGRLEEARDANAAALVLFEDLVAEAPDNGEWAHAFGWELIRRGQIALDLDERVEAAEAFRRAADVQATLVSRAPSPHTFWLDGLAIAYEEQARAHADLGASSEALEAAESALATRRKIAAAEEASPYYQVEVANIALLTAELRAERGNAKNAWTLLDEAGRILDLVAEMDIAEPMVRDTFAHVRSVYAELTERLGETGRISAR